MKKVGINWKKFDGFTDKSLKTKEPIRIKQQKW